MSFCFIQCLRWPNSHLHTNITPAVLWGNIFSISLQPETNWLFSKHYLNCSEGFSKRRQDPITGCLCAFEKFPHFHNGLYASLLHGDHPCEKEKGTPIPGFTPSATTCRIWASVKRQGPSDAKTCTSETPLDRSSFENGILTTQSKK